MPPLILISTRGCIDVLTFRDPTITDGCCARMGRRGIAYEMEVFK
jgi:hypothetical protein